MTRLIIWALLLYLGWRAYQTIREALREPGSPRVEGDSRESQININEEDIEDADFKDLDAKE